MQLSRVQSLALTETWMCLVSHLFSHVKQRVTQNVWWMNRSDAATMVEERKQYEKMQGRMCEGVFMKAKSLRGWGELSWARERNEIDPLWMAGRQVQFDPQFDFIMKTFYGKETFPLLILYILPVLANLIK